jgi:pimeloyl-ACP methyl ester carboxylesterase
MSFLEINGRSIYYEDHGKGDTVLLLHHGFASSGMWKGIYPSFVKAGYRVVMYDRRGYGRSDPGSDFEQFYVSDQFCAESVEDLAVLREKLDLGPLKIVGQCEGGVIGLIYAARFRDQITAAVISSTLCHSNTTMAEFNRVKFPKPFHELDPRISEKMIEWHGEERVEPLYEMARTRGGAYGSDMFDLRPILPAVICPAMILYPDRSALFEVEQAVAFYRGIPNAELAVIPRCGHNTYDQRPEDYQRLVLDFFERVEQHPVVNKEDFSMTCLSPAPSKS